MKKSDEKKPKRRNEVVLLRDLAPRKNVKAGSGQILFGQSVNPSEDVQKKEQSKG
ncbi:MAG TPA: hypothetical protein VLT62_31170 [Candidatus Methylomirabilis sp.]|nr:hypothetical protein [Candidatus Methylomirabilis sp.]